MPFNGSGIFNRIFNFVTDRNNGIRIQAPRMDQELDGIAEALSNCLTADGQSAPSANIPMNGKRLTNLGDPAADTDALNRRTGDERYLSPDEGDARYVGMKKGTDIASAGTINLNAATAPYVGITGTTTITSFGEAAAGVVRYVRFADALTLVHNATVLDLPGGENLVTEAGDTAIFVSDGSGLWRCFQYNRARKSAVGGSLRRITRLTATTSYTKPAWLRRAQVELKGGGGGGGGADNASSSLVAAGGGGGEGCISIGLFDAADISNPITVTIGQGGTGGLSSGGTGSQGGTSSFGALMTAGGGQGGGGSAGVDYDSFGGGGAQGGSANSGANHRVTGASGDTGLRFGEIGRALGGQGGGSGGGSPTETTSGAALAGINGAVNTGGGGSGASVSRTTAGRAGGPGGSGYAVIYEYD